VKVISRKELNGLNQKTSLSKGFSKRRAAKILVSRLLELSLRKSWGKFLHRLERERSLWKAFSKRRAGKLSPMCYPKFTSKISLIISLPD